MGRFIKYLTKRKLIYAPSSDIRATYEPATIDRDVELIILAGRAKDPTGAARLMAQYKVSTAAELLPLLPKRRRPSIRARLKSWARSVFGLSEFDPALQRREQAARASHNRGLTITTLRR